MVQALEDAITEQHEQERSIENEIEAYRKDIVREQIRNEQLTAVMTKLEGESGFLNSQNDTMVKKQEKLQVFPLAPHHLKHHGVLVSLCHFRRCIEGWDWKGLEIVSDSMGTQWQDCITQSVMSDVV